MNTSTPMVSFICNICGTANRCPSSALGREDASCSGCGSTVRMRSIVHLLTRGLTGRSQALPAMPADKTVRGVGLSDWEGYAGRLAALFDYANTFYHQAPVLDISAPPDHLKGTQDFVISTDVFEHVFPPVQAAFDGAFALLRPGGHFVFTVPFTLEDATLEHYPGIDSYEVVKIKDRYCIVYGRPDGGIELDADPIFHGGPGQTLELRRFCKAALIGHLEAAGFTDITIDSDGAPEWGIIHSHPWSLPIYARRPG